MVEFSEGKFIPCRELFLTKSSVNRTERSIPFCDRGVFRMFISHPASCTYRKVYIIVNIQKRRVHDIVIIIPGVDPFYLFIFFKTSILSDRTGCDGLHHAAHTAAHVCHSCGCVSESVILLCINNACFCSKEHS